MIVARLTGAGTPFDWPEAIGFGRAPFASAPAGAWQCTAGPNGLAVNAFAWIDPATGQCSNNQPAVGLLGLVLPVANLYNLWERAYVSHVNGFRQLILRPGVACVLAVMGDFLMRFPLGATAGSRVYADPTTGLPYTDSNGGTNVPTPWTAGQSCGAGGRARISTSVQPVNT